MRNISVIDQNDPSNTNNMPLSMQENQNALRCTDYDDDIPETHRGVLDPSSS
jgi:hypothetical protein